MTPLSCLKVITLVLITACCATKIGAAITDGPVATDVEPMELVKQLGDDQFVRRELAMARLIEIGTPAIAAVEEGVRSLDREVRYRSQRILSILRRAERTRQIAAFLLRQTSANEEDLPGWNRLRDILGDSDAVRQLYARMVRREWELLARLDRHEPDEISGALALRVDQLQATRQGPFTHQLAVAEGTFAALLLVALEDDLFVADQTVSKLWGFCRDLPDLQRANPENQAPSPLRNLLGFWVQRRGDTLMGLSIAMKYGLKDGLIPAKRLLEDNAEQQHVKQYAILTVAKFGGLAQIPLLTAQLEDSSVLSSQRVAGSSTLR